MEKKKKHMLNDISILSIDDMKKKEKTQICLICEKILSNSQKTTIFIQQA